MQTKKWEGIKECFRTIELPETFDVVVAIADGGIIPAALINQRLQVEWAMLKINLRDEYQRPKYDKPQLLNRIDFDFTGRKVLLVDDRVKTGATLEFAKNLLKGTGPENGAALVRTFAVNGPADYSLYNEPCFHFPWLLE